MIKVYKTDGHYFELNETIKGGYGEMYIHDNAIQQTLTDQDVYYKIVDSWLAGENNGFTIDTANAQIICGVSGTYVVNVEIDYNGSNNDSYMFAVFVNGVQHNSLMAHTDARQLSQTISCPISGIMPLSRNDILDVRARCSSSGGTNITVVHCNLSLSTAIG